MRIASGEDYGLYLRRRLHTCPLHGAMTASVDTISLHEWLHDLAHDPAGEHSSPADRTPWGIRCAWPMTVRTAVRRAGLHPGGAGTRRTAMDRSWRREFGKHPIRVAVEVEEPSLPTGTTLATTIYNGRVILGNADVAQLAWGNRTVYQTTNRTGQITPGFEAIAQAVVRTLERLPVAGLSAEDLKGAEAVANEVLVEVNPA
jgi:hypothetical protein